MNHHTIVFSGQGSQFVGMGRDCYEAWPDAADRFHAANHQLNESVSDIMFNGPDTTLAITRYTQVAIFLLSVCLFDHLKPHIHIHQLAGHSLGEITAYYAAGVLDFESALGIVIKRGQLMNDAATQTNGRMAAIIGLPQSDVESIVHPIDGCCIANYNSPVQFVISGDAPAVQAAIDTCQNNTTARVIPLPVSGAFHSPLMASAVGPFRDYVQSIPFHDATYPIILNRHATPVTDAATLQDNLAHQIQSPVRWIESIQHARLSGESFIEVGPGKVLSGLIKKIDRSCRVQPTSTVEGVNRIIESEEQPS